MASQDEHPDPVEIVRRARNYLKASRGIERFRVSLAAKMLDKAEKESAKCIDYLLSEKARSKGVHCCCKFHEAEYEENQEARRKRHKRDGKAAAAGEDNQE